MRRGTTVRRWATVTTLLRFAACSAGHAEQRSRSRGARPCSSSLTAHAKTISGLYVVCDLRRALRHDAERGDAAFRVAEARQRERCALFRRGLRPLLVSCAVLTICAG